MPLKKRQSILKTECKGRKVKNIYITKTASVIFTVVSIVHLINFFIGGVISVWGFAIPANISLVLSLILGFLAFKLRTLK